MFYVVGSVWNSSGEMIWLMSPVVPVLSSGCGGSRVFGVYHVVVALLLGLMVRSTSGIASGGDTSMYSVSWVCCCS